MITSRNNYKTRIYEAEGSLLTYLVGFQPTVHFCSC